MAGRHSSFLRRAAGIAFAAALVLALAVAAAAATAARSSAQRAALAPSAALLARMPLETGSIGGIPDLPLSLWESGKQWRPAWRAAGLTEPAGLQVSYGLTYMTGESPRGDLGNGVQLFSTPAAARTAVANVLAAARSSAAGLGRKQVRFTSWKPSGLGPDAVGYETRMLQGTRPTAATAVLFTAGRLSGEVRYVRPVAIAMRAAAEQTAKRLQARIAAVLAGEPAAIVPDLASLLPQYSESGPSMGIGQNSGYAYSTSASASYIGYFDLTDEPPYGASKLDTISIQAEAYPASNLANAASSNVADRFAGADGGASLLGFFRNGVDTLRGKSATVTSVTKLAYASGQRIDGTVVGEGGTYAISVVYLGSGGNIAFVTLIGRPGERIAPADVERTARLVAGRLAKLPR